MRSTDVIVVGLGVTGAAVAARLASAGLAVAAFDRYHPPHSHGSSHGLTRIIREAYFEDPIYVPWVRHARRSWLELERTTGRLLHQQTGVLNLAPGDTTPTGASGSLAGSALASARLHDVPCEALHAAEIARRLRGISPPPSFTGVFEPGGGVLFAEPCVEALLSRATAGGAELHTGVTVDAIRGRDGDVEVVTSAGTWSCGHAVLAAGSSIGRLVPDLRPVLTAERQTQHWFGAAPDMARAAADMPVTIWELDDATVVYTLPDVGPRADGRRGSAETAGMTHRSGSDVDAGRTGPGIKAGLHHGGAALLAGEAAGPVTEQDWSLLESRLRPLLPVAGARVRAEPCMYVNTPDRHFIIDAYPPDPRVIIASACSGHGFKFAPSVADVVASLIGVDDCELDRSAFRIDRPALALGGAHSRA